MLLFFVVVCLFVFVLFLVCLFVVVVVLFCFLGGDGDRPRRKIVWGCVRVCGCKGGGGTE